MFSIQQSSVNIPIARFGTGQRIRVVGKPTKRSDGQFHIKLCSFEDILLHFNPMLEVFFSLFQES